MPDILKRKVRGDWYYAIPTETLIMLLEDAFLFNKVSTFEVKCQVERIADLTPMGYHIIESRVADIYGTGWSRLKILSKQKNKIQPVTILVDISPQNYHKITSEAVEQQ